MRFYRSQFWRLQKQPEESYEELESFIGHNFGDYKNLKGNSQRLSNSFIGHNFGDYKNRVHKFETQEAVLSVTILETTKTGGDLDNVHGGFYRSQFWRLQKPPIL